MEYLLLVSLTFSLILAGVVVYLVKSRKDFRDTMNLKVENKQLLDRLEFLLDLKPVEAQQSVNAQIKIEELTQLYNAVCKDLTETRLKLVHSEARLAQSLDFQSQAIRTESNLKSALEENKRLESQLDYLKSVFMMIKGLMQEAKDYDRPIYKGFFIENKRLFSQVKDDILPRIIDMEASSKNAS